MAKPYFCSWEELVDLPLDQITHPSDRFPQGAIKALLGWNGLVVWDADIDPVDLLRAYLEKAKQESCGQCFPCRLGTERLAEIINKICDGRGSKENIEQIEQLVREISDSARCDIGRCLAKPVLDLMAEYQNDFLAVINGKRQVRRGEYEASVTAPCISACPSHIDIPAYLELIRLGRYKEALATVRQDCPLPGTIGRVCVRPCETHCRRGLLDEPLAIRALKRFLADRELSNGGPPLPERKAGKNRKVAIVGAGPAGLSCAYYLGIQGYDTTIFEAQEGPGGMAAYGIPSYRLPRDILAYEVSLVEKVGAEIRYGVRVGVDITAEELGRQGYGAVFLAVGAPESAKMRCEGEDAGYRCYMTGINFLAEVARGRKPIEGKKLVVVGGGNVAMDCVRSALRIGFTDVNLLYRRTEAEMPADRQEIEEAREEGVRFHYLVAPLRIVSQNGRVTGIECLRMELGEPDASGRRRPVPIDGSEFVIDCDAVIPAVGQICVVDCVLPDFDDLSRWKTLVVDETTFQSRDPLVFGGGDCITGPDTLIAALAAGKNAARFIAQYLEEGACHPGPADLVKKLVHKIGSIKLKEKFPYPGLTHRAEPKVMPPEDRIKGFEETEDGLPSLEAHIEASRCLRCYRISVAAV